jgi:serine/threonine protein phosphatase PrpC
VYRAVFYSGELPGILEVCALTDPGRVRTTNQDFFRIVPELGLYVVADGMGGARGGARASQVAVETVEEILGKSPHRDAAALLGAVEEANQRVLREATSDPRFEGMGTTLVAALETGDYDLAIASVGDSRAYVFEAGKLRAITEDQTWVQEVGRTLGIDEEALKTHPMRHVLTMAVGVGPAIRIRYYGVNLKPDTLMMLSSDGLHGVVPEDQIEQILDETHATFQEKCAELISAANEAGSPDNVTVLLIRRAR